MISVFDIFKIGIGPSSSHTVGPMVAGKRFRDLVAAREDVGRIEAEIYGSLAWTGRGHGTDIAVFLGLLGHEPATIDPDIVDATVAALRGERRLGPDGPAFDPATDLIFNFKDLLPRHTNGMRFRAFSREGGEQGGLLVEETYYSIGGGFVVGEFEDPVDSTAEVPVPFDTMAELLEACARRDLTIAQAQLANELALRGRAEVEAGLDAISGAMFACIERGFRQDGLLPGGLKVRRRAKKLYDDLSDRWQRNYKAPHEVIDWISLYAIAVNEENASGGRVVTAPTNGAAGIIPSVMRYAREFCPDWSHESPRTYLLTAAAIGGLIKRRASISGAEVGCQGEVGSASAMAAAGLAALLGGSPAQIENAAEIAMEHHLGMTCDPIGGLVQVPCIERNAFGANKAVVAASLALHGDGIHRVTLDEVIETMRQTGLDMQDKYKETSLGGLAVNVAAC